MRTLFLTLALTAGLAGATGALARQQAAPSMPPPPAGATRGMGGALMRADANNDGIVTREEAIASSDQMYDRMDANHDGTVTPDEMRAARDAMRPGGAPPRDGMGATPPPPPPAGTMPAGLTRQQWHDRALRQFDRIDANHDGRLDRTEIANYQEAMRERRMERREAGGMAPPPADAPAGQP